MLVVDNLWIVLAEGNKQREKGIQTKMVTMNDVQEPYEHNEDVLGENMQEENIKT